MEDVETLKKFISGSGFSEDVQKVLFDCVLLQMRNSPSSEFLKTIRNYAEKTTDEN